MNIKTLATCGLIAIASTAAQAETTLPEMNMSADMVAKAQAESSATSAGNIPLILFILFVLFAASQAAGGEMDYLEKS